MAYFQLPNLEKPLFIPKIPSHQYTCPSASVGDRNLIARVSGWDGILKNVERAQLIKST